MPGADKLDTAELCVNLKDHKLYSKDADGDVFELGKGASVPGGDIPPSSGNEIGDLFFDTLNEILLYWDGTEWLPVTGDGYVKLDDKGQEQFIAGGGVLNVEGNVTAKNVNTEALNLLGSGGGENGLIRYGVGPEVLYEFNSVVGQKFTLDGNTIMNLRPNGDVTVSRGVNSQFGTPALQFGTVAPMNDWSCYPARV